MMVVYLFDIPSLGIGWQSKTTLLDFSELGVNVESVSLELLFWNLMDYIDLDSTGSSGL